MSAGCLASCAGLLTDLPCWGGGSLGIEESHFCPVRQVQRISLWFVRCHSCWLHSSLVMQWAISNVSPFLQEYARHIYSPPPIPPSNQSLSTHGLTPRQPSPRTIISPVPHHNMLLIQLTTHCHPASMPRPKRTVYNRIDEEKEADSKVYEC